MNEPETDIITTGTGRWVWTEIKNHLLPIAIAIAIVWFVTNVQQKVIEQLVDASSVMAAAVTRQAEATEGTNEFLRVNGALPLVEGDESPASASPSSTR